MEQLGVEITPLAYELHPEVPPTGRAIRPGGRLDRLLDRVAEECAAVGLPIDKPRHTPNTRRALEIAEILRTRFPNAFVSFDERCYRTHWVDGGDVGDPQVLRALVSSAGADPTDVDDLLARGIGSVAVDDSMAKARDIGVTAAPAWWVDERLLIPGAQPRETVQRWVTKLAQRSTS
jgi:predicted DsbA family dithiol-disulfide isomerase